MKFLVIFFAFNLLKVDGSQKCSDSFTLPSYIPLENLTAQINNVIEHYKQIDPIGIPIPIPDPFDLPNIEKSILGFKLNMTNVKAFGISKFRIHNVTAEFDKKIEASCALSFEELQLSGNYSLKPLLGSLYKDVFTIEVLNLEISGKVELEVSKKGKLRAKEIEADADVTKTNADFVNIPGIASPVMKMLNSGDKTLFNLVKSNIIEEAKLTIKTQIDAQIEENLGENFLIPNSIPTVDFAISEARKMVKKCNDPYKINDYTGSGMIAVNLRNTELRGVSSFYRNEDMKVEIIDNKIYLYLNIGTQEVKGKSDWEISMLKGIVKRKGKIQFNVEFIKVFIALKQPLNLSKSLKFDDLQLEIGNIQVLSDGLGTLDYLIEFFINTIPNLLRYQLMDALEPPLRKVIQEVANGINAENLIKSKLKELHENGAMTMNFNKIEL